jgi:hypothetical protein
VPPDLVSSPLLVWASAPSVPFPPGPRDAWMDPLLPSLTRYLSLSSPAELNLLRRSLTTHTTISFHFVPNHISLASARSSINMAVSRSFKFASARRVSVAAVVARGHSPHRSSVRHASPLWAISLSGLWETPRQQGVLPFPCSSLTMEWTRLTTTHTRLPPETTFRAERKLWRRSRPVLLYAVTMKQRHLVKAGGPYSLTTRQSQGKLLLLDLES